MEVVDDFAAAVRTRLKEEGTSVRAAAMRAKIPVRSFQGVLDGQKPSIERAAEICNAVGLEFYIGPPREGARGPETADSAGPPLIPLSDLERSTQGLVRLTTVAGGNPIPDDLWPVLMERRGIAAVGALDTPVGEAQPNSTTAANDDVLVPFARDVRAAAGSGEMVFEEEADLHIAIPRSLLPPWIRPSGLIGLRAAGDSMEPTLNDGDVILLDRRDAEPVDGQVFVIYTDDGLLVKRLREDGDGWELTSDNPVYPPRRSGESDRIVGRVAWSGALRMTEAHGG